MTSHRLNGVSGLGPERVLTRSHIQSRGRKHLKRSRHVNAGTAFPVISVCSFYLFHVSLSLLSFTYSEQGAQCAGSTVSREHRCRESWLWGQAPSISLGKAVDCRGELDYRKLLPRKRGKRIANGACGGGMREPVSRTWVLRNLPVSVDRSELGCR